jgi:iron complex transport system ATP-binding protein
MALAEAAMLRAAGLTVAGRLQGADLDIGAGECVAVLGPNGAGKSTLLRALAGLLGFAGSVRWMGRELKGIPHLERGRTLAWLGQESMAEFAFRVKDVVAQGRFAHGDDALGAGGRTPDAPGAGGRTPDAPGAGGRTPDAPGALVRTPGGRHVAEAMEALDILHIAERPITELSGGELRRVFLARALATAAPMQLWDEPASSLDVRHALEVYALTQRLAGAGSCVLVSLHDIRAAYRFGRAVVLDQGRIVADGPPHDVLTAPLIRRVFRVEARFLTSLVPELPGAAPPCAPV